MLNIGDQVNVIIKEIDEMGCMVTLPDYNNTEGFIPGNRHKHKVGSAHMVTVIRICKEKGYVDLQFNKNN